MIGISSAAAAAIGTGAADAIRFSDLGLRPEVFTIGFFSLRWYSLGYIVSIVLGWWYLLRLLKQPGAPMARRHADDLVFYATLGIILGGRLGYVLFYAPDMLLNPIRVLRLWDGGMSFHGGVIGTSLALILFARNHKLDWLRVHDYVAVVVPFGPFFVRIANFINGELWGAPTNVPWGIVFDRTVPFDMVEPARHPSQLYEAVLEGPVLFAILWFFFWRTKARYHPGKLVGIFLLGYGALRFLIEYVREPDSHLRQFAEATGLHMGQWLCVPMIAGGAYLVATSKRRRQRVEPIAGTESVA